MGVFEQVVQRSLSAGSDITGIRRPHEPALILAPNATYNVQTDFTTGDVSLYELFTANIIMSALTGTLTVIVYRQADDGATWVPVGQTAPYDIVTAFPITVSPYAVGQTPDEDLVQYGGEYGWTFAAALGQKMRVRLIPSGSVTVAVDAGGR